MTEFQRAELGLLLEPIERELAKRRQREHGNTAPGRKNTCVQMTTSDKGKTRDAVAKKVGLSPTTYQRAKAIIEHAPEEVKKRKSEQARP